MTALATPQLIVNDIVFLIKPNSLSYTEGFGERKVRVKSAGGGSKVIVVTRDLESEYSMVKFTAFTEDVSIETIRGWQEKLAANTIRFSDAGLQRAVTQAIVTNDPEINFGVDGEIDIEFQGNPAV